MMAQAGRVVAELGRPETPEETASRKAESSRIYRSSQTFRNLIAAILATLAIVLVVVFGVPRGTLATPDAIDVAEIASGLGEAYGRTVISPDLPGDWRVNSAKMEGDEVSAFTIVYVPDVASLSFEQARDELVTVVAELEQGSPTLEHSLALWERGEALAARCEEWLLGAKRRLDASRPEAGAASRPAEEDAR